MLKKNPGCRIPCVGFADHPLFLDFRGFLPQHFNFLAEIQFIPALLALNVGIIVALVMLTLIFGTDILFLCLSGWEYTKTCGMAVEKIHKKETIHV